MSSVRYRELTKEPFGRKDFLLVEAKGGLSSLFPLSELGSLRSTQRASAREDFRRNARSADLAFSEKKEEGETALGLDGEKVFSP